MIIYIVPQHIWIFTFIYIFILNVFNVDFHLL